MSALIYRLAIGLYALAVRIAALFNKKAKLSLAGRKDLLYRIRYALLDESRPRIWMHCASLGEFEQGRPVLERLRRDYPGHALVLTFFSPSGYEVRKDYSGVDYVFYLPIDTPGNAQRFLELIQPKLCIFVKYEFWYYLLKEAERRNIPTILISAIFRPSQPFFKWYGRLHKLMLYSFTRIFVQDEASAQLLLKIGIDDALVAGDTRFDRVLEAVGTPQSLEIADAFAGESKILIAGSTWPEDEVFLQKVFLSLSTNWKLIIAPHEVDAAHIAQIQKLFGGEAITWTAWTNDSKARVLIIDKIGLLLQLYYYGNVAWIGGGFGKGIHNTLEAAVYAMPLAFGPVHEKFREAKGLIECGGAFSASEPGALANAIINWERDGDSYLAAADAARQYVLSNAGATGKIMDYLAEKKVLKLS